MAMLLILLICCVPLLLLGVDLVRNTRREDERHGRHGAQSPS